MGKLAGGSIFENSPEWEDNSNNVNVILQVSVDPSITRGIDVSRLTEKQHTMMTNALDRKQDILYEQISDLVCKLLPGYRIDRLEGQLSKAT